MYHIVTGKYGFAEKFMQNRFVKAAMDGLKPCITGIILSTGIMMIAGNAGLLPGESVNIPALCLTTGLSAVYFGSGAIIKKRISPIGTETVLVFRSQEYY